MNGTDDTIVKLILVNSMSHVLTVNHVSYCTKYKLLS